MEDFLQQEHQDQLPDLPQLPELQIDDLDPVVTVEPGEPGEEPQQPESLRGNTSRAISRARAGRSQKRGPLAPRAIGI